MVKLLNFLTSFCLVKPLKLSLGYIKGLWTWKGKGEKDRNALLLNAVFAFYYTH